MVRFVSTALLLLLLAMPAAMPLLAHVSCCPPGCEPVLRPASSCCNVSAVPQTTTPARLAISPELAAPSPAGLNFSHAVVAAAVVAPPALPESHSVFLSAPLRI